MLTFSRPLSSGSRKIAAAFILAVFVLVTATSFDAAAKSSHPAGAGHKTAAKSSHRPAHKSHKKKPARHAAYSPPHGSIVIDADTGEVLSQNNADARVYPASLTKLMTLLLTFEGIERNNVSLLQRVPITSNASRQPPSKLNLPAGSSILMRDAIYAIVTKSANDIAVAVGENVGGTEGRFVYLMNQKAKQLGMTRTRFVNPSGLHNPQQVTTPRDFARLAHYIIRKYPREYKYFATRSFTYNGTVNRNHNRLMETYAGMDGMKTGYTIPSGFNLAASAVRNHHRLIAVVMGGKTAQLRNNEVARLLDDGFEKLARPQTQQLVATNTIDAPDRHPAAASSETVPVPASNAMSEMEGQGDSDPAITRRFETGMMAINAIKTLRPGQISAAPGDMGAQHAAYDPSGARTPQLSGDSSEWAIQLGSYGSRVQGDRVLTAALPRLPGNLRANAKPIIAPLKAGEGWVYRARLQGFSREEASAACKYFSNCMAISPRALP